MAQFKVSPKIKDQARTLANIDRAETILRELRQIVYELETRGAFELEIKGPTECESDGPESEG